MINSLTKITLKTKTLFTFLLLICFTSVFSQIPNFTWAKNTARGTGYGTSEMIAIDASDNVYLLGTFNGTIDVDPGPLTLNLVSAGSSDVFVSKFNSAGTLLWAKSIGGTFYDGGKDIKLDASGNIYVCGQHYGVTDLDPGVATFTVSGSSSGSSFIIKLDNSGNFVWGKALVGTSISIMESFDVDASGNLYITGQFSNLTDFDPGVPSFTMNTNGGLDAFIMKLDNAGIFQWAKSIGGVDFDYGVSIKCDASGNPVVLGSFGSILMDFDPGSSTFIMSALGSSTDIFILKLNATGNFMWAKQLGGTGDENSTDLTLDASGNLFATGAFNSIDADFDPGVGTYTLAASPTNEEIFCVKLDQAGNFIWANKFGGNLTDRAYGISVDNLGGVYLTGRFEGTADFDPGPASYTIAVVGQQDIFISRFNASNGNFVWARSFGSVNSERGNCVLVNSSSDVFSCGYFYSGSAVDFDPSPNTFNLTSLGVEDAYIHKMSQCSPPAPPINTSSSSICEGNSIVLTVTGTGTLNWYNASASGTLITSGTSYTTPVLTAGTYTYYVEAETTCTTSLVRAPVTLTVLSNPTVTVISSNSLLCAGESATLTASGANSYTWSLGGNAASIVVSPTATTSYSILGGSSNGCFGSAVFSQGIISCVGLNEVYTNEIIANTYPNPTTGNFVIETSDSCVFTLTNNLGKVISIGNLQVGLNNFNLVDYPDGVYFLNLKHNSKQYNIKIIKL